MNWTNYYKVQLLLTVVTVIFTVTLTLIPLIIGIVKVTEVLLVLGIMLILNHVAAFAIVYIPKGYKWLKKQLF